MKLRLLRNATLKLEILGKTILIDPFFAPKGSTTILYRARAQSAGRVAGNSGGDPQWR